VPLEPQHERWSQVGPSPKRSTGHGFQDIVDVEGRSRYVRIKGVTRGSQYGYSLFDVTICGERP
jgi:hypothetical protein